MNLQAFVNKWVMRIKESRTVLTVILWGVMAITQVLSFVRPYLNTIEIVILAGFMVFSGLVFTYLYDKLEIMKGEHQQRIRRKDNFIGESMVLQHLGFMALLDGSGMGSRRDMMENYLQFLEDYQNGISLKELKEYDG